MESVLWKLEKDVMPRCLVFTFFCCAKTREFFKKLDTSHGGASEIFGGLHPFLKKKTSR